MKDQKVMTGQEFTPEQVALIKTQIAPKATDDELQMFLYQCKRTGLDPLTRQIYCIHRKQDGKEKMSIQTSIDGFRVIAERSGVYGGQSAPVFEEADGMPVKCTIAVYKFKGTTRYEAAVAVAYFKEYVQTKDEWINNQRTGRKIVSDMWARMPHTMLAKVAEALALRKAFPQDLSGLYTDDEMGQAANAATSESGVMQQPAQLPAPTSVPFQPNYTQTAEPVPAGQQRKETPFNVGYTDPRAITATLAIAKTKEDVVALYNANRATVDGSEQLKAEFSKVRKQMEAAGKVIITDKQLAEVKARVMRGDLKAAESAKGAFLLNEAQAADLQKLVDNYLKLEAAVVAKYDDPSMLVTIVNACYTEAQVNTLHKNNSMIMDRDQLVAQAVANKLKAFKVAA